MNKERPRMTKMFQSGDACQPSVPCSRVKVTESTSCNKFSCGKILTTFGLLTKLKASFSTALSCVGPLGSHIKPKKRTFKTWYNEMAYSLISPRYTCFYLLELRISYCTVNISKLSSAQHGVFHISTWYTW